MFQLHERTRRQWCLAGFLALCAAPTAAVVLWCAVANRPGRAAAEAARLSQRLGLQVAFDDWQCPRPGAVRYAGLRLSDPETGQAMAACEGVEAVWTTAADDRGVRRPVLAVTLHRPQIETAAIERLTQLAAEMLQAAPGRGEFDVRLAAAELTLGGGSAESKLKDVQAAVESLSGGAQAAAAFRLAGVEMPEPARLRLVRNRQTSPPTIGVELDTGGSALPGELLAFGLRDFAALGSQCRFRGYLWTYDTPDGPAGEAFGQLLDVDLGRLVSANFPHRLTGRAQVAVESARFRGGRLESAALTVTAGPGEIGRLLLEAGVTYLKMVRTADLPADAASLPYDQLAFAAVLDASGVQLQGRCATAPAGTLLIGGGRSLLAEPLLQPQSLAALLQMLAPAQEQQMPATRETDWLARRLPAPPPLALPAAAPPDQAPRTVRLRLGRTIE